MLFYIKLWILEECPIMLSVQYLCKNKLTKLNSRPISPRVQTQVTKVQKNDILSDYSIRPGQLRFVYSKLNYAYISQNILIKLIIAEFQPRSPLFP